MYIVVNTETGEICELPHPTAATGAPVAQAQPSGQGVGDAGEAVGWVVSGAGVETAVGEDGRFCFSLTVALFSVDVPLIT